MTKLSEEIWQAVELIRERLKDNRDVISIGVLADTDEDTITVTVTDVASIPHDLKSVAVSGKSFKVEVRKGTPLVPYVGDLENDKPLKIAPALENVGGI
jgi:hypothetical protein